MRTRLREIGLAVGLMAFLSYGAEPARAVTDEEIFREFRFNFINPGGRALGLGGASIASVDDSTASLTNPGAMVTMIKPEFFIEYRAQLYDARPSGAGGNAPSPPSGGTAFAAEFDTQVSDISSVSYAAFVYPTTLGGRPWVFSVGRQELLNYEARIGEQSIRYRLESFPPFEEEGVTETSEGALDIAIVNYNLGVATNVTSNWSVGVTASYSELNLDSFTSSRTDDPSGFVTDYNPREEFPGIGQFGFRSVVDDQSDTATTFSVGLLWQPVTYYRGREAPIKLGLTWNRGAEFEVPQQEFLGSDDDPSQTLPFVLKVPDRYGLGFAYQFFRGKDERNRILWAIDAVHVKYTDLLEGYQEGLNPFNRGREIAGQTFDLDFTVDDGVEARTGVEWTRFFARWRMTLRGGYAYLPDNRIRLEQPSTGDDGLDLALVTLFPEGDAENVYSVGATFAYDGGKASSQIDFGYQFGDDSDQAVVSYILRF
jgi:hypothetical protein